MKKENLELVFLVEAPLSRRDISRFQLHELRDQGFTVQVWDLSQVFHPGVYADSVSLAEVRFTNLQDAVSLIKKTNAYFMVLLGYSWYSRKIFRSLSKCDKIFGSSHLTPRPSIDSHRTETSSLAANFARRFVRAFFQPHRLLASLFFRTPAYFWGIRNLDFYFYAGQKGLDGRYPLGPKTLTVSCPSLDYQGVLGAKQTNSIEAKNAVAPHNSIVFLDEFGPYHPDFQIEQDSFGVEAQVYFKKMNEVFQTLQRITGKSIQVCAHPRSDYEKRSWKFENVEVTKNNTLLAVKNSDLVLAHASTAVNYAVIFKKPILLLAFKDQLKLREGYAIRSLSRELKAPLWLVDQEDFKPEWLTRALDSESYALYFNNYIFSEPGPASDLAKTIFDALNALELQHKSQEFL